jgi:RimJ/RimL family protein N-acetyltransferase
VFGLKGPDCSMAKSPELLTERLLLRRWRPTDREPFAAQNADPRVMEHFPAILSREESDNSIARIEKGFERRGFGLWAVEVIGEAPFVGFIGLSVPSFETHFTPCVEIGWRLAAGFWNRGYATEGARAALKFGFEQRHLNEIVAFTVPANVRSRRVMDKLGMTYNPADDFDHPHIPEGQPLRRHVLYRITGVGE